MQYISDLGYNVIAFDFPGYGKSTGKPTIEENSNFADIFYESMKQKLAFEEKDLVVWGYSIGTALAIEFAKDKEFDVLLLMSPFASRYDMSAKAFNFPVQKLFFLPNTYISEETIKLITEPTFIIHGNNDIVVPFEQGKRVFNNSNSEKKYFLEIDDFGHSLIPERYGQVLERFIIDFIETKDLEQKIFFIDRQKATEILKDYEKKLKQKKLLESLDLKSDTSIHKFVSPNISFQEKSYVPNNMRALS